MEHLEPLQRLQHETKQEHESRVIKAGANELKLIEFVVGGMRQGINLIKVKKIIKYIPEHITPMVQSPPEVLGLLEVDNNIISIIDMRKIYELPPDESFKERAILITEFNKKNFGFVVDNIDQVHRLSWESLQPVNDKLCPTDMVNSIATVAGYDILMIDFEMIIENLFPDTSDQKNLDDHQSRVVERRKKARVICVDDSNVIRKKLQFILKKNGFSDITFCNDGQEAYDAVKERNKGAEKDHYFTFMVTDIEMPQMNGLSLCKLVKTDFPNIPVLVLSSLISPQVVEKCKEVGADDTLSKGDMNSLVHKVDRLMEEWESGKSQNSGKHVPLTF